MGSTNQGVEDTKNYRHISTRRPRGVTKTRALRGNVAEATLYHYYRLILDLIRYLVERNIIPETLVDNLTLHSILLTQIMLETLNGISVPKARQGNTFTYHANAKGMIMWELGAKNAKHIKSLEEQTGVNLDHYHKLGIMNI